MLLISILFFGCSTKEHYFISDAKLNKNYTDEKQNLIRDRNEVSNLLLSGHYISSGNSTILMIRNFDRGNILSVDDETYEKFSIELKNYEVGVPIEIGSLNLKIYYSAGSSGFARKGHGVYADSGKGIITIIENNNDKLTAKIDFTTFAKPAGAFPLEGKRIKIKNTFVFRKKKISDLSPWLGVPDILIGKEVYP